MVRIFPTAAELPHRIFVKKHGFYALFQDFSYTFDRMISHICSPSLTHSPESRSTPPTTSWGNLNLTVPEATQIWLNHSWAPEHAGSVYTMPLYITHTFNCT